MTVSFIDSFNEYVENYYKTRDPLWEQLSEIDDTLTEEDYCKAQLPIMGQLIRLERTYINDEKYIWLSTTECLTSQLVPLWKDRSAPDDGFCGHALKAIWFPIVAVIELVETVVRAVLALIILPFIWIAAQTGCMEEKTFTFLTHIALVGGTRNMHAVILSLESMVDHVTECPSALCSSCEPTEAHSEPETPLLDS